MTATQLCPCGSGLRAIRCCSLQIGARPPAEATRHLVPLVERAMAAHRQGATDVAERLCLDVLELAPDRPGALSVLYEIRKAQGSANAAEALIRRIVALDPNNLVATNELALILLGKGNLADAEMHARNAVRIAPENPQAHNLMGMIMTEANRPQIGEYHYRRVLDLSGAARSDPACQPRLEPEEPGPDGGSPRAVSRNPPPPRRTSARPCSAVPGWRRPTATSTRPPSCSMTPSALPRRHRHPPDPRRACSGRMRRHDEALAVLDETGAVDGRRRLGPNELLEKGRLLDQMGRYDDAWAAFAEGKRAGARAVRPHLSGRKGGPDHRSAAQFLHRRPAAPAAARRCARRRAATDLHPGLPALRHHAGGTNTVGASAASPPATSCR